MISTFYQKYKVIILLVLFLIYSSSLFISGVKVHQYYVGYQQNLEKIVQDGIDKGITKIQKEQAKGLIETQDLLKNAKTHVITEKLPLIVDRPIYLQSCVDEDGVQLLKDFKEQSNKIRKGIKK